MSVQSPRIEEPPGVPRPAETGDDERVWQPEAMLESRREETR